MQQRLLDIGAWLDINGESIYGTRKWEGSKNNVYENVFFTKKGSDLYVLCTELLDKPVMIKGIKNTGKVSMLGLNANIQVKKSENTITINPPILLSKNNPSEYAWVFKIENIVQ